MRSSRVSVFSDLGGSEQAHDTHEDEHADDEEEAELQLDLERRADSRNPAFDPREDHRLDPHVRFREAGSRSTIPEASATDLPFANPTANVP